MSLTKIMWFVLFVACLFPAAAGAQTLGLFFDGEGTQPTLGDSLTTYPVFATAFLIVNDIPQSAGIEGWEASLSWTPGLYLTLGAISGQSVNVKSFPEFMVGSAAPLGTGMNSTVVATINIVAMNAGDIYLGASSVPSIPGCDLPVGAMGGSLWPMALAHGGVGLPVASIGKPLMSSSPLTSMSLGSSFAKLEYEDGEIRALTSAAKGQVLLPRAAQHGIATMSFDQLDCVALLPMQDAAEPQEINKNGVVAAEGFESYTADSAVPFAPNIGCTTTGTASIAGGPLSLLWGVTDSRCATGTRSAHCAAIGSDCTNVTVPADCVSNYRGDIPYPSSWANELLVPLASDYSGWMQLTCKVWSDIRREVDQLVVFVRAVDNAGQTYDYPLAALRCNLEWGEVSIPIPSGLPQGTVVGFAFVAGADDGVSGDHRGVYVDDVELHAFESDLRIQTASATRADDLAGDNIVHLEIENGGSMATGAFNVTYVPEDDTGGERQKLTMTVPSIEASGSRAVDLAVPFAFVGSASPQSLEAQITVELDAGHRVPEIDETNNITTMSLSWGSSSTAETGTADECRGGGDMNTPLYGWPAPTDPWSIDVCSDGTLFAVDPVNGKIAKYNLRGQYLGSWGQSGVDPGEFDSPGQVAAAENGRVAVLEEASSRHRVQIFSDSGAFLHEIDESNGLGPADETAVTAIGMSPAGVLFVSERANDPDVSGFGGRILRFDSTTGAPLGVFAECRYSRMNVDGEWVYCGDIDFTPDGYVFLLDDWYQYDKVLRFSASGFYEGMWGQGGTGDGQFNVPTKIAVRENGNVLVTDMNRIQEFTSDGQFVARLDSGAYGDPDGIDIFYAGSEFCVFSARIGALVPGKFTVLGPRPVALNVTESHWLDQSAHLRCTELALLSTCDAANVALNGVVADGVSVALMRMDLPVAGAVRMALADPGTSSTADLGNLFGLCSEAGSTSIDLQSQNIDGRNVAFGFYRSPLNFDRSGVADDSSARSRPLGVTCEYFADQADVGSYGAIDLLIHRPTMLFVHGLWDGPSSWIGDWNNSTVASLGKVDYRETHGEDVDVNVGHLREAILNEIWIERANHVAASQVDVVAHSMGGVLARRFHDVGDFYTQANLRKGYYHKLLFLDVPNLGSPLADVMVALRGKLVLGAPGERALAFGILGSWALAKNTTLEQVIGPAIDELSVGSPILNWDPLVAPCHIQVGVGGSDLMLWSSSNDPGLGLYKLLRDADVVPEVHMYDGIEHDAAVGRVSQTGGLAVASAMTIAHNEVGLHWAAREVQNTGVLANALARARIGEDDFLAAGLPGTTGLLSSSMGKSGASAMPAYAGEVLTFALSPGNPSPGTSVTYSVAAPGNAQIASAVLLHEDGAEAHTGPAVSGQFEIPLDALGAFDVVGWAVLDDGSMASTPVTQVQVNIGSASVQTIDVTPSSIILEGPGSVAALQVVGQFSDGVTRDIGKAGYYVQYTSADDGVVTVDESGSVYAVSAGSTSVRIRVHEPGHFQHDAEVTIEVRDGAPINNPPHAHAGAVYSYCGGRELCLDGSQSADLDLAVGDQLSFAWDLDGDGVFDDATGVAPCMTPIEADADDYVGLKVTDREGRESVDYAKLSPSFAGCRDGVFQCEVLQGATGSGPMIRPVDVAAAPDGGFYVLSYDPGTLTNPQILKYSVNCAFEFAFAPLGSPLRLGVSPSQQILCEGSDLGDHLQVIRYSSTGARLADILLEKDPDDLGWEGIIECDASGKIYRLHREWEPEPSELKDVFLDVYGADGQRLEEWNLGSLLGVDERTVNQFCIDPDGNMYIVVGDHRIQYVQRNGATYIPGAVWGDQGGAGQIEWILDIDTSAWGDVFVAESRDGEVALWDCVSRFAPDGEFLGRRTGSGTDTMPRHLLYVSALAVNDAGCVFAATSQYPASIQVFRFDQQTSSVPLDPVADPGGTVAGAPLIIHASAMSGGQREATIRCESATALRDLRMRIFDLQGRLVRDINVGVVSEGITEISWDCRNGQGALVGAGMYLVRLDGGGHVARGKIVVLH